jgi:hypothetical protein
MGLQPVYNARFGKGRADTDVTGGLHSLSVRLASAVMVENRR